MNEASRRHPPGAAAGAPAGPPDALSAWRGERVVVPRLREARGAAGRALGLMFRADLPRGEGLWLRPCGDVHTCFMRFPLDLVFLDEAGSVVRVARGVRPWRLVFGGRGARSVIEVRAGWLGPDDLRPGDRVTIRPAP